MRFVLDVYVNYYIEMSNLIIDDDDIKIKKHYQIVLKLHDLPIRRRIKFVVYIK